MDNALEHASACLNNTDTRALGIKAKGTEQEQAQTLEDAIEARDVLSYILKALAQSLTYTMLILGLCKEES